MAHALLSPSGASRWLACTPSARLEQSFPDRAGEAAQEGTLAHALAELLLKHKLGLVIKNTYSRELQAIMTDKLFSEEMLEFIETYTDFVIEQFELAKMQTKDAMIFLETRLDMSDYVPDGFGTGDVCIVADGVLDFIDLKYGKGVPVYAEENKQMMLYALGALKEYSHLYDIHTVRMTINQPRLDSISSWEITVNDLTLWAEKVLKPKAQLAFEGKGEFNPGKACQFCKAKAICRANADYQLRLADMEFRVPELLEPDEVAEILKRKAQFLSWLTSVSDYALLEAVHNGAEWPGFKLVEGRSNRKYVDETKVAETLVKAGFGDDVIYTKKLLGITAMEKAIGKKPFTLHLAEHITKPQGSPTLVEESDKRPIFEKSNTAMDDFALPCDEIE